MNFSDLFGSTKAQRLLWFHFHGGTVVAGPAVALNTTRPGFLL